MSRRNDGAVSGRGRVLAAALVGIFALFAAVAAEAASYTVGTTGDTSGDPKCSLRDAINAANGNPTTGSSCSTPGSGNDTITFSVTGQITLTRALSQIGDASLTITGPATSPGITIDGANSFQVLSMGRISGRGITLNINRLTIADGKGANTVDQGAGGIDNMFGGQLTITSCTFLNNGGVGAVAGAIYNLDGKLTVTNSTFYNNKAAGTGGIENAGGSLTIINSTFFANQSTGIFGGGITNFASGKLNMKGTILAGTIGGVCYLGQGIFNDNGYNLSDDSSCRLSGVGSRNDVRVADLDLGVLATNGGPTKTIALTSAKSIAVDQIPTKPANFCTDANGNPLTTDQRGEPRPDPMDGPNGKCDIGAYEFQGQPPIDCSKAVASSPQLIALPGAFFPEYINGVIAPSGAVSISVTAAKQAKPLLPFPLCPNASVNGATTFVRASTEALQGPGGLLYQIQFGARATKTGATCTGAVAVCVQDLVHQGEPCSGQPIFDATKCP